jgi:hypothetical protein
MLFTRILASLVVGFLGTYYFMRGKKAGDIKLIFLGIGLTVLSFVIWGLFDSDDVTKGALKSMLPAASDQQLPQ